MHDTTDATPKTSIWFSVTRLSKTLTLLLLIALPFIGGWIGYTHAPEKGMEIQPKESVKIGEVATKPEIAVKQSAPNTDNWQTYTMQDLGIRFKYPPNFSTVPYNTATKKPFEYVPTGTHAKIKGRHIVTVLRTAWIDIGKDVTSLKITLLESTTGFLYDSLEHEKDGIQVSFDDYDVVNFKASNPGPDYRSIYGYKFTEINDMPVLLYKRNYHGLIGNVYNAYFVLGDGRILFFGSEEDNAMLDSIYHSVEKIK